MKPSEGGDERILAQPGAPVPNLGSSSLSKRRATSGYSRGGALAATSTGKVSSSSSSSSSGNSHVQNAEYLAAIACLSDTTLSRACALLLSEADCNKDASEEIISSKATCSDHSKLLDIFSKCQDAVAVIQKYQDTLPRMPIQAAPNNTTTTTATTTTTTPNTNNSNTLAVGAPVNPPPPHRSHPSRGVQINPLKPQTTPSGLTLKNKSMLPPRRVVPSLNINNNNNNMNAKGSSSSSSTKNTKRASPPALEASTGVVAAVAGKAPPKAALDFLAALNSQTNPASAATPTPKASANTGTRTSPTPNIHKKSPPVPLISGAKRKQPSSPSSPTVSREVRARRRDRADSESSTASAATELSRENRSRQRDRSDSVSSTTSTKNSNFNADADADADSEPATNMTTPSSTSREVRARRREQGDGDLPSSAKAGIRTTSTITPRFSVGDDVYVLWEGNKHYEAIVRDVDMDGMASVSYTVEFANGEVHDGILPKDLFGADD